LLIAKLARMLTFLLLLVCIFSSSLTFSASAFSYHRDFIFTYINEPPYGNWTFTSKPVRPVRVNASQIQVGTNWTYVYTLAENHSYHVYCYGDWIHPGPAPTTDYDIYVYNPFGELEGYHTEAAGLPEHLGTTVDQPFFTPRYSGNYSFVVRNDPRESSGAEPATFMAIEHVDPNRWCHHYVEGKTGANTVENTIQAYEFTAASERIEIQVHVPDSLDMYEARLYLMANPSSGKGAVLNGVPLAWENALYGEASGSLGGYNLDSQGFRGNAYASCEYYGQDMLINYSTSSRGESLYHLVLIGELGAGNVSFRIKTDFGNSQLQLATPIPNVYPDNATMLTVVSTNSNIQEAFLYYSTDSWNTSVFSELTVDGNTCNGTIPGYAAGVTVSFRVEAYDFVDNLMIINSSYSVKYPSFVNFTLTSPTITLGENISVRGFVTPASDSVKARVKVTFMASNGSAVDQFQDLLNSSFSASFRPTFVGAWSVKVQFMGDQTRYDSIGDTSSFAVEEPSLLSKYAMYIYAGTGTAAVAIIVLIMIRRRQ
jgi:hypothetical protein